MNKKRFLQQLLFLWVLAFSVSLWGQTYTLDLAAQASAFGASNAYGPKSGTVNGVTWYTNAASSQSTANVWLGTNSAANRTSLTKLSLGVNGRGGAIASALGIGVSDVGYYAMVGNNAISNVGSIKVQAPATGGTAPGTLWCLYTTDGGTSYTVLGSATSPGTTEQTFTASSPIASAQYAFVFYSTAYGTYRTPYFKFYSPTCTTSVFSFAAATVNKTTADADFTNAFTTNNSSPKSYLSSDTDVATVNASSGEVTLVGAGTATISVTQIDDGTHCAVSDSYVLNVTSTTPTINAAGTLSTFTYVAGNGPSTEQSFIVSGSNLTTGVTVTAPANFEVSTTSGTSFSNVITLPQTGGDVYARMVSGLPADNYSGDIVLTSPGATDVNVAVDGSVALGVPTAAAATDIASDSFTANWNAVTGADSYELDVYTGTTTPATTITETFTAIAGSNASSYLDRTWTGDGGITWTAYKSRTDESVNDGNDALTLKNETGAYLESGVIANGLTNISFDVKQVFSGSGGVLTVKVLSGPTFATVTTIGTIAYSTTASTYDSGPISGITGTYKIRIENNAAARPAIDNLSFTGLPNSTQTYVRNAEDVGNVTSYEVNGLNAGTIYKYVVRAKSGAAVSGNSNEIAVTTLGTAQITWDGSAWSNGTGPTSTMDAIIDGNYNIGNSFEAKSVTVNTGNTLTVTSSVKAEDIINEGSIIVADNASFIQTSAGNYSGTGTFTVNRESISPVNKYAFWSSPVVGQNMFTIFPTTAAYVMTYNTATNFYDTLANPATAAPGVGYSIKTPATAPPATFAGAPNNGTIGVALSTASLKYNLVGNPYPSNLDLAAFYTANTANIGSTLYFWDNTGGTVTTQTGGTAVNSGYAIFNAQSGTWNAAPNGLATPAANYAKIGQGFIVEAVGTSLAFDNTLRVANAGENFNKNSTAVAGEGKYWLTLSTSYNAKVTQAVTYQNGASNEFDSYDSKAMDLGSDAFYSFVGAEKVVIQGKAPFNTDDVVQLGNKHFENGTFKIELTQKEGLFADGQAIYLKDNLLGTEVNLQDGAYSFTSDAGDFSNRFEIAYTQRVLGTDTSVKNELSVYRQGEDFVINSSSKINSVEVYDASGRLIKSFKGNGNKQSVTNLGKGVYILHIQTATENVSKKVIK